ncbi:MAG: peroxiredoxin [Patiriisocius sp.]|jgi:peroxiredoxin
MRLITTLLVCLLSISASGKKPINNKQKDSITVYIFLLESCRISQFYTLKLKELHKEFGSNNLVFKGVFPNPDTKIITLESFRKKYDLSFDMVIDHNQVITKKLGATVTPEAIVYNEDEEEILYKGRIDDSYFRVGKRKQVSITNELKNVLAAVCSGEQVEVEWQAAIGCIIQVK